MMPSLQLLMVTTLFASFFVGACLTLLTWTTAPVRNHLKITTPRQQMGLAVAFLAFLTVIMILSGWFITGMGAKAVLIWGSLIAGFSLASLGLTNSYQNSLIAAALLGTGTAMLHTALVVIMPRAFLNVVDPAGSVNLGYIAVALGGLLMPKLYPTLLERIGIRRAFLGLGLAALLPAGMAAITANILFPDYTSTAGIGTLLQNPLTWIITLGVFFYYCVETSVLSWTPNFLHSFSFSSRSMLLLQVTFWVALLGARALAAFVFTTTPAFLALLLVLAILTAVSIGNMIGIDERVSSGGSYLFLGGCLGPILPTMLGLITILYGNSGPPAVGLICGLGMCGKLVSFPVMDGFLKRKWLQSAMWLTMIAALVVAIMALMFMLGK